MTKIPPVVKKAPPKDLRPLVQQWHECKANLKAYEEQEMALRLFLVAQLFPSLEEGVNRHTRPGLEATCKRNVYRKVDKTAFSTMATQLRTKGINVDALVEMEPKLALKAYRALPERQRKLFESVLMISDGTPSLDINLG